MLNLEIKVRVENHAEIAEILSAFFVEDLFQTDTYFKTKQGTLKLREQKSYKLTKAYKSHKSYMMRYKRKNMTGGRYCKSVSYGVGDLMDFMDVFRDTLQGELVIFKRRSLYIIDNAKVHLDKVDDLGKFLEIVVTIKNETQDNAAPALLARILNLVNLVDVEGIDCGYKELIEKSAVHQLKMNLDPNSIEVS